MWRAAEREENKEDKLVTNETKFVAVMLFSLIGRIILYLLIKSGSCPALTQVFPKKCY